MKEYRDERVRAGLAAGSAPRAQGTNEKNKNSAAGSVPQAQGTNSRILKKVYCGTWCSKIARALTFEGNKIFFFFCFEIMAVSSALSKAGGPST